MINIFSKIITIIISVGKNVLLIVCNHLYSFVYKLEKRPKISFPGSKIPDCRDSQIQQAVIGLIMVVFVFIFTVKQVPFFWYGK